MAFSTTSQIEKEMCLNRVRTFLSDCLHHVQKISKKPVTRRNLGMRYGAYLDYSDIQLLAQAEEAAGKSNILVESLNFGCFYNNPKVSAAAILLTEKALETL